MAQSHPRTARRSHIRCALRWSLAPISSIRVLGVFLTAFLSVSLTPTAFAQERAAVAPETAPLPVVRPRPPADEPSTPSMQGELAPPSAPAPALAPDRDSEPQQQAEDEDPQDGASAAPEAAQDDREDMATPSVAPPTPLERDTLEEAPALVMRPDFNAPISEPSVIAEKLRSAYRVDETVLIADAREAEARARAKASAPAADQDAAPAVAAPMALGGPDGMVLSAFSETPVDATATPSLKPAPTSAVARAAPIETGAVKNPAYCGRGLAILAARSTIYFEAGSVDVRERDREKVLRLAKAATQCDVVIIVRGMADRLGSDVDNMRISWVRAVNTIALISEAGLDAGVFRALGVGAAPVLPEEEANAAADESARLRRVEFVLPTVDGRLVRLSAN